MHWTRANTEAMASNQTVSFLALDSQLQPGRRYTPVIQRLHASRLRSRIRSHHLQKIRLSEKGRRDNLWSQQQEHSSIQRTWCIPSGLQHWNSQWGTAGKIVLLFEERVGLERTGWRPMRCLLKSIDQPRTRSAKRIRECLCSSQQMLADRRLTQRRESTSLFHTRYKQTGLSNWTTCLADKEFASFIDLLVLTISFLFSDFVCILHFAFSILAHRFVICNTRVIII